MRFQMSRICTKKSILQYKMNFSTPWWKVRCGRVIDFVQNVLTLQRCFLCVLIPYQLRSKKYLTFPLKKEKKALYLYYNCMMHQHTFDQCMIIILSTICLICRNGNILEHSISNAIYIYVHWAKLLWISVFYEKSCKAIGFNIWLIENSV